MVFLPEDCSKPGILFITCCRWEIKAGFCKTPHLADAANLEGDHTDLPLEEQFYAY